MTTMLSRVRAFIRDEEGASAVEYGIMVALISAVIVGVVYNIGQDVKTGFDNVHEKIKP